MTTTNKVAAAAKHVLFILGNKLIVVLLLSACRGKGLFKFYKMRKSDKKETIKSDEETEIEQ